LFEIENEKIYYFFCNTKEDENIKKMAENKL